MTTAPTPASDAPPSTSSARAREQAPTSAAATYAQRLGVHAQRIAALERTDANLANARLLCFTAAAFLAVAAWLSHAWHWHWALVPAAGFCALVVLHAQALSKLTEARRRHAYYADGLLRLAHKIPKGAPDGASFGSPEHPYAGDLDLFGEGGLFQLLCTARSRIGESTLAHWLLRPSNRVDVERRQRMVQELRSHIDLREDLACLGEDMRLTVHPQILTGWAEGTRVLSNTAWRTVLCACNVALLASVAMWNLTTAGPVPFLVVVMLGWGISRLLRDRVAQVMAALEQPGRELAVIAQVMERLRRERFTGEDLQRVQAGLDAGQPAAAESLRQLGRLNEYYEAHKNQAFAPIAWFLLWSPHFAFAVEAWRDKHGKHVRRWLETLGELEALASLGCYAFERPTDTFPTLVDGPPRVSGEALGHPLLADPVRNDVTLDAAHPLLMVSGSNMSGKSTFLRTIGTNVVLALAGAPVRARGMTLTPLAVGATLRVQDSLQRGTSRFYAEIKRLQLLQQVSRGPLPMLFLLDEVLAGTNSHDRAIGAAAVIHMYLTSGGIGLVTTHDLALAQADAPWRDKAVNVHFVDDLLDGKLHFDYQVRPGVVQHSNALALMRSVGLYADTD